MPSPQRKKNEDPLLLALACGATVESAARQCGLSDRTVYRRLQDPGFKHRLDKARADMVQRSSGMLTAAAGEAVRTLLALQRDPMPATVRLGAARGHPGDWHEDSPGRRVRAAIDGARRTGREEPADGLSAMNTPNRR